MLHRKLGKQGLEVSAVGLCCKGIELCEPSLLLRAVDMGQNFFDAAMGTDEDLLGKTLQPYRKGVVLATTFRDTKSQTSKDIRRAAEESLQRFHTNYIDLYYYDCKNKNIQLEEVAAIIKELHNEGKILHWGLKNPSIEEVQKVHKIFPLTAVQNEYSMWKQDSEELLALLEELEIGFVPVSTIGGKSKIKTTKDLEQFADYLELSVSQISLAWLLYKKPWIVPISEAESELRLRENMSAAYVIIEKNEFQKLEEILK